ncbi:hypothetical protein ACMGD3_08595 [Lysinibacillus sphaericus]|uniref:hypothetical protein n=1 Tax=Lysinibacillus sphaericus TaxID=1421 RepID=UPI003F79D3AF
MNITKENKVIFTTGGRFREQAPSRFGATSVLCPKAKRQQQDVGHEGFVTGRDAFSLRSHKA